MKPSRSIAGIVLVLQNLEERTVPSTAYTINPFENLQGWKQWTSSPGATPFAILPSGGTGNSSVLASDGVSRQNSRLWQTTPTDANTDVQASIFTNSLAPVQLLARGKNLDSTTPTYYGLTITRGVHVDLVKVVNGVSTTLASLESKQYLSNQWLTVSLHLDGNQLQAEVMRRDTGGYLNSTGLWQAGPTSSLSVQDSTIRDGGFVGINRVARYAGVVRVDDFTVLRTNPTEVSQPFDSVTGPLPGNWSRWSSDNTAGFSISKQKVFSPGQSLADTGSSRHAARSWLTETLAADTTVSAAVLVDSLIPAQLFVRGTNLQTTTPSYYAVSLNRGTHVEIQRVTNGDSVVLASLDTAKYVSNLWMRVYLSAQGDRLQVRVQRTDTNQWLTSAGLWSDSQVSALNATDTTIAGEGQAGFARSAKYAGTLFFDDFQARIATEDLTPPKLAVNVPTSDSPLSGMLRINADATDASGINRVEFLLDGQVRATPLATPFTLDLDTTTIADGIHLLEVRAIDQFGNVTTFTTNFFTLNRPATPSTPEIPRHYDHIRIAQLAYSGNPIGSIEESLLKSSVDLVIQETRTLGKVAGIAPQTPQLVYSNVSNLYLDLLTDWLNYADRTGASRESAFYHVSQATSWSGTSPSSQPVTWLWNVLSGPISGTSPLTNLTEKARSSAVGDVGFGGTGNALNLAQTEKFRELNFTLSRARSGAWNGVIEYASAVDGSGNPIAWRTLKLISDTTTGFFQSGTITFDPPADWVSSRLGGSAALFYLRVRTVGGTAAEAPIASTILGRDYSGANGRQEGTIPAFDAAADRDGDGYLDDAEYANRATGKNARFLYESRLFYPYYGEMRFVTNPSSKSFANWAADYEQRFLASQPLAEGLFMDNSHGKIPLDGASVLEPTATYSTDFGNLLGTIEKAIAPKYIFANTAGGWNTADDVVRSTVGSFEEFAIRPMSHNYANFLDLAELVKRRQSLENPPPYLILDSLPSGGSPTDPRTQIGTLAYYYMIGNPDTTFLMFYGGYEPSSSWSRHWSPAAAYNVGKPQGDFQVFASGRDPGNPALKYEVFSRNYDNALVLYKPLSYTSGQGTGTTADNTGTTHLLNGNYRQLQADGSLGAVVQSVTLRNGEGAILIKA